MNYLIAQFCSEIERVNKPFSILPSHFCVFFLPPLYLFSILSLPFLTPFLLYLSFLSSQLLESVVSSSEDPT